MIAAEAATPSRDHDTGRLYTVRLTGPRQPPNAVPDSDGNLFSMVAWSPDGAWLFYQGPDVKLWGYQPRTGAIRGHRRCHAVGTPSWSQCVRRQGGIIVDLDLGWV
jgi:hypothetical protein